MIQLDDITLRRGPETLLENTGLTVHAGRKIGLVGANGCGKSSLFALLLGELETDAGTAQIPAGWTVAHMAQQITELDRPAIDYVLDGDARLRAAEAAVADADRSGDGQRIARAHQSLDDAGGYDAHARAGALLNGLGFDAAAHEQTVGAFSGGWRIRLSLARALMCPSDLLLLDEPTNHLDLETIIWLEDWLKRYAGTLVLISHDRDFLDAVVDGIVHIEHKQLNPYTGGYTEFERRRAERMALQHAQYEKQQRQIAHMQAFIDRFRAKAAKARQAQSRIKALERMETVAPAHIDSPFDFEFPEPARVGDPLIALREANLGYEMHNVLRGVSLNLNNGDRIGLLGVNGAGKSTLVRALAGQLKLQSGRLEFSRNLTIGYFAQHQLEQIDESVSPLVNLSRIAGGASEQKLRNFLGGFAFSGDLATDACARLSGGERARLVLAMIIWTAPHLLLLDEPTNHLDLEMRHALTVALQGFEGAVVTVSHDRHLLTETVDEYWLVDGNVKPFKGGLEAYRRLISQPDVGASDNSTGKSGQRKAERQRKAAERERLKPLTRHIAGLTRRIEQLESRRGEVENKLADAGLYDGRREDELKQLLSEDADLKQQLQALETQWMEAEAELETLKSRD